MAESDVDALRAVYQRWAVGDFGTPEIFHDDVEVTWAEHLPDLTRDRGVERLGASFRRFLASFDDCTFEAERFHDLGGDVFVLVTVRGKHKRTGMPLEWRVAHLWTMRDGRAAAVRGFADRDQALAEFGIES